MSTYIFHVELKESEGRWHACVPDLEHKGAATWGQTREEALRNIQEVMQMVVEEILEDGESMPPEIRILDVPAVAVNV